MLDVGKDSHDIGINILASILIFCFGFFWSWARRNIFTYMIVKRKIVSLFTGKKYILIWNDNDVAFSEEISRVLEIKGLKRFFYKHLGSPEEVLYYPGSPEYVQALVFIVMDVTKIADNDEKRTIIENKLAGYVRNGGCFIGTHDLIYRRCRNTVLQNLFGCELFLFERTTHPIAIVLNPQYQSHPLLKDIPSSFSFDDGEVVTGNWDKSVHQLVVSSRRYCELSNPIPMLCLRFHQNFGYTIWISCGDKKDQLPGSLHPLQSEFTQLIYNSIKYKKEIKVLAKEDARQVQ